MVIFVKISKYHKYSVWSILIYTEEFKECAALQAQYIYDTYGRFSATVQNVFSFLYLQVQHLDLDFDDHYFKPGAYLTTHKEHMEMAQNPKLNDITTHAK